MAVDHHSSLVAWRFSDGKRGHDSQSLGLVEALASCLPLEVHSIDVATHSASAIDFLLRRFFTGNSLPSPHLIVGAGHATHWPMLVARHARGGRIVVLMKPSWPLRFFDLCVIPRHDEVRVAANVVLTEGAVNRVRPSGGNDASTGLMLIGGPSTHYTWDEEAIYAQVRTVLETGSQINWVITDSPRTPAPFAARLRGELAVDRSVKFVHYGDVDANWLPAQLAAAGSIWVTADSVSMLYEALSSGAAVGVLQLPASRDSRVVAGVQELIDGGRCLTVAGWASGQRRAVAAAPLREAERCARWIKQRWFSGIEPHDANVAAASQPAARKTD